MTQAQNHAGVSSAVAPCGAEAPALQGCRPEVSLRRIALYVGLVVLLCQLLFVHAFFPSFPAAAAQAAARQEKAQAAEGRQPSPANPGPAQSGRFSEPDLLQWSGAQSLNWIASLFAPQTPVRFAPALVFFLVAGGFFSAIYRPPQSGRMATTVLASSWSGMRMWLSWFGGAVIVLVYVVTSSGGLEALKVSAGITFDRPWTDISDAFLSHWLIYLAWFGLLGFLPMLGGAILGLVRTRLLTQSIPMDRPTTAGNPPATDT